MLIIQKLLDIIPRNMPPSNTKLNISLTTNGETCSNSTKYEHQSSNQAQGVVICVTCCEEEARFSESQTFGVF